MKIRWSLVALGALTIVLVYLFQDALFPVTSPKEGKTLAYLSQKVVRFLVNDLAVILIIYGLFRQKSLVKVAFIVQVGEVLLLLIPYLILKLQFPSYNGPFISHLHRLVVNPLLMLMLIPIFYYKEYYLNE